MKVYLDNAATTRLDPRVLAKMKPYLADNYGNASSIHALGQAAFLALSAARQKVAKVLNGQAANVIFTSGATEANNLIIKGVARANRDRGNTVIVSEIEHPCVLESARELIKEGFNVKFLPVNREE